jgi:hypothetical protein
MTSYAHIHTVYKCFFVDFLGLVNCRLRPVMGRQGGNPPNCQIFATEKSRAHTDMESYPGVDQILSI